MINLSFFPLIISLSLVLPFWVVPSNIILAQTAGESSENGGGIATPSSPSIGATYILHDVEPIPSISYRVETIAVADHSDQLYEFAYIVGDYGAFKVGGSWSLPVAIVTHFESWRDAFTLVGQDVQSNFQELEFWAPPHWHIGQLVRSGELGWLNWNGTVSVKRQTTMPSLNGGWTIGFSFFSYPVRGQVMLYGNIELFEVLSSWNS